MIFIHIQYISQGLKSKIPFRIVLFSAEFQEPYKVFNMRPMVSIPKKIYNLNNLDRLEILASEPFCNSADELIELFQDQQLVFSEKEQFTILKSQFRTIGYNFHLKPNILWSSGKKPNRNLEHLKELISRRHVSNSLGYAEAFLEGMQRFMTLQSENLKDYRKNQLQPKTHDLLQYKRTAGVYFFLNAENEVIYVGKAKNVRKRLQSHFSNSSQKSNIDYSQVQDIDVVYTGNDVIAQLVESENIKTLKPRFNTQQINNSDPYMITFGTTAKGIFKIMITRKEFEDSLPEKYYNRKSVVDSLRMFCSEYNLCRKHCGLEKVKGPCSNVTKENKECVCSGEENIVEYNKRFQVAYDEFRGRITKKIYKLKGRHHSEDAFIYEVNGIYEGYGYIDKSQFISNYNDILGHLNKQQNNYDTTRIVSSLDQTLCKEDILKF